MHAAASLEGAPLGGFVGSLTPAVAQLLLSACQHRSAVAGDAILDAGAHSRHVCILLAGSARVHVDGPDGRRIPFRDIAPGDIVGELAAIDGIARSATVEALAPVRYAVIADGDFRALLAQHPDLSLTLLRHLSTQVRTLTRRVFELSALSVAQRVRAELLRLAAVAPERDGVRLITPAPRHADIAARLATHREAVTREISRLVRAGVVRRVRGAMAVDDVVALAAHQDHRLEEI